VLALLTQQQRRLVQTKKYYVQLRATTPLSFLSSINFTKHQIHRPDNSDGIS